MDDHFYTGCSLPSKATNTYGLRISHPNAFDIHVTGTLYCVMYSGF